MTTIIPFPGARTSLAQRFDNHGARSNRYPIDPAFRWVTQKGESMKVQDMNIFHLYHSLRMIWNHTVPEMYKFLPYKPYHLHLNKQQRRWAIANLVNEIMNRPNRPAHIDNTIAKMCEYVIKSKRKQLPKSLF